MERHYRHLSDLIDGARLPQVAKERVLHILGNQAILNYKGLRLLWLLTNLRSGRFETSPAGEKQEDIENLIYLLRNKDQREVSEICYLFFEAKVLQTRVKYVFPREMVNGLIKVAKEEKSDIIKELIWGLLLSKESHLHELVTPDELVVGLWFRDPITRNNTIRLLIRRFDPDSVVRAVITNVVKTGKKIPEIAFAQLTRLAKGEEEFKKKRQVLTEILKASELADREIDRIWAGYLRRLNRFELIRMFSWRKDSTSWIEDLKAGSYQLSLGFKAPDGLSCLRESFAARVNAILD